MPGPDSSEVSLKCQRIIEQLALLGIRYVREPTDSERGAQDVRPLNEVLSWRLAERKRPRVHSSHLSKSRMPSTD